MCFFFVEMHQLDYFKDMLDYCKDIDTFKQHGYSYTQYMESIIDRFTQDPGPDPVTNNEVHYP